MGHDPVPKKSRGIEFGSVEHLVGHDEMAGSQLFFETPHRAHPQNAFDPQRF
jgi:hypothetical protein